MRDCLTGRFPRARLRRRSDGSHRPPDREAARGAGACRRGPRPRRGEGDAPAGPRWVACARGPVRRRLPRRGDGRSEEHTSELQSQSNLVCRLLLEKKKKKIIVNTNINYKQLYTYNEQSNNIK